MREVNITELRSHLHKYLESMQKGNEVLVTRHGQVIAHIASYTQKKASIKPVKRIT